MDPDDARPPAAAVAAGAARRRSLWRNPDFLALWTGQTVSELGSRISREGIPLTALLVLHAGAAEMGLLTALGGAAGLVFGLAAGVWVDRLRRRPVLIATDLGRAALLATIPAAALAGRLGMGQLYVVVAAAGMLTIFFDVAYQSYLPALVEREQILEGNAKLMLSSSIAEVAGPGLTGFLVQWITAPLAILLDALSFLGSALLVAAIRKPEPPPEPRRRERLAAEAVAGLRWIFAEPALRALGLRSATAWLFLGFFGSLYLLFAIDVLHLRPAVLGLIIATGGAGAMAGAWLAGSIERRFPRGATFIGSAAVYGLAVLLIPLAAALPRFAVALLATTQLIGDMAFTVYAINEVSLRQRLAPARVLGRVNAGMQLLARGVYPVGALIGGALGARIGVPRTLALAAAGTLLSNLWLLAPSLRRLR
jgi:predicted MFS family arabinose efflux permease